MDAVRQHASDEDLFVTQNTFKEHTDNSGNDTDYYYSLRHGHNSQLHLGTDSNGKRFLEYIEDVSKCNPGGIKHRKITRKHTKAYENAASPDRCIVSLYQKCISLRYVLFA